MCNIPLLSFRIQNRAKFCRNNKTKPPWNHNRIHFDRWYFHSLPRAHLQSSSLYATPCLSALLFCNHLIKLHSPLLLLTISSKQDIYSTKSSSSILPCKWGMRSRRGRKCCSLSLPFSFHIPPHPLLTLRDMRKNTYIRTQRRKKPSQRSKVSFEKKGELKRGKGGRDIQWMVNELCPRKLREKKVF